MMADSPVRSPFTRAADSGARMDTRVRTALRMAGRHIAPLSSCSRTCDRSILDDVAGFVARRQIHTFLLDSRSVIQQIDHVTADVVSMDARTRELFAALRHYLVYLAGVLVIEPPAFRVAPRRMDLRCIAFAPEVRAFVDRIEALVTGS